MADFKKLHVWQRAHALSLSVDRASKRIRASQYASLRNQIFRAAVSIPANIAEGRRQRSEKEFARFLSIALNSASELEYHLILARDTKIIPESEFVSLVSETIRVRKMLYALMKRLAESTAQQSPKLPAAPPTAPSR
jgi:four helix bundle protein